MLLGIAQSGVFCYGRAVFQLRGSGFSVALTEKSLWHKCFLGILGAKRQDVMSDN